MLRKAHDVKQAALAVSERMRNDARVMRAEAMAVLDRARREAAELLQAAAVERGRLDEQTEEARECLRRVTAQIGDAIEAIAGDVRRDFGRPGQPLPLPHRFAGNTVQRLPAGTDAEVSSEPAAR
jgi:F0F1-type ATP synthase membrane subunit b/b'